MFRVTAAVAATAFALFMLLVMGHAMGLQPPAALGTAAAVLLLLLPLVLVLELLGLFGAVVRGPG